MIAVAPRRRRPVALATLGLALAVLAGGCTRTVVRESTDQTTTTTTGGGQPSTPTSAQPALSNLPPAQQLALQVKHPNGTTLQVNRVSFHEDNIQLQVSVTNGGKNDIKLADFDDMILRDNLGSTYRLSPPPQNPDLTVAPATTIQVLLVFLGRVQPGATHLTLTTNARTGSDTNEFSRDPRMVVPNIPVGAPTAPGQQPGSPGPTTSTSAPPSPPPS
ncbi:MAG: hypothetical protein M3404_05345 [Actinomycetota bacterium]|nr:hypothetical protein [Actinomycetota bacterium]